MKIIVLGGSGMLGSMVVDYLSGDSDFQLTATARNRELLPGLQSHITNVQWRNLDAGECTVKSIRDVLDGAPWVINAIGVIKPYIHDDNATEVERAVTVNSLFPHLLARAAEENGCRVLQIATDCVFSGLRGDYSETDAHDPLDVYGKTKSLGEVYSSNVYHLRCSIIGPEPKGHVSLMDWLLRQPRNGSVNGYANHRWNGVTTLHFAKLCRGVIKQSIALPHIQHVLPAGTASKAEMLRHFALDFHREDITINPTQAATVIDRTLATQNESLNRTLWKAAGYTKPPSVPEMIAELAQFNFHFSPEHTE
ncbi:MAG: SDR family oxidoreductase [Chloroflexi bacterium]|nr:SDR family oxidoreductase [Chloroflexota bacterium]